MYYYQHSQTGVITRKSEEKFPDSNCCSDLNLMLDTYNVVVLEKNSEGFITKWELEDKIKDQLAPNVRDLMARLSDIENLVLELDYKVMNQSVTTQEVAPEPTVMKAAAQTATTKASKKEVTK